MRSWRSRMRRSRTSSPENCNAVCEAAGGRSAREGPRDIDRSGLRGGEAVADGVVSATGVGHGARSAGDRVVERPGGTAAALGLLEALRPAAARRPWHQPQTTASGVLRDEAQFTAANEAPPAATAQAAAAGSAAAERDLGARLHVWDSQTLFQWLCVRFDGSLAPVRKSVFTLSVEPADEIVRPSLDQSSSPGTGTFLGPRRRLEPPLRVGALDLLLWRFDRLVFCR